MKIKYLFTSVNNFLIYSGSKVLKYWNNKISNLTNMVVTVVSRYSTDKISKYFI